MSIQNIMNVCFAICITLLIYQNTQLKDKLDTADFFAQHSVDETWDRMDRMEARLDSTDEYLLEIKEYSDQVSDAINKHAELLKLLADKHEIQNENVLILEQNDKNLQESIDRIEKYIIENFSGKLR